MRYPAAYYDSEGFVATHRWRQQFPNWAFPRHKAIVERCNVGIGVFISEEVKARRDVHPVLHESPDKFSHEPGASLHELICEDCVCRPSLSLDVLLDSPSEGHKSVDRCFWIAFRELFDLKPLDAVRAWFLRRLFTWQAPRLTPAEVQSGRQEAGSPFARAQEARLGGRSFEQV